MKEITWGEALAYESVASIMGMGVYALIWLLAVLGIVGTSDILTASPGTGAVLLVLGMVLSMLVNMVVVAAYIGESVTEQTASGKVLREYNRVLLALKASFIAYIANVAAWFVTAAIFVYKIWPDSGFHASDLWQGINNLPLALEYLAARGFGNVSAFWIATQVTYTVFSIFALKGLGPGKKVPNERRRPPRGRYHAPRR